MKKGFNFPAVGVGFFCHDGKGKFLMQRRSKNARDEHGTWDIGGGGIDFGLTVREALEKEVKEEYCADILDAELLGYSDVIRDLDGKKSHWLVIDWKVLVDPKQVRCGEPHKFDATGWFTVDSLPSPLHSVNSSFFKKYAKMLF